MTAITTPGADNAAAKGRKSSFRFAERCLYDFQANEARLKSLLEERELLERSSSVKAQNYDPLQGIPGPSDAVSARVERLEKLDADIRHLERRVRPIQRLVADLEAPYVLDDSPKAELMKILRLYYFGGNVPIAVAKALHIGKAMFYRKRQKLVDMVIKYLGL